MNLFLLSWKYIKDKPLNTFLNVLLMGLGIAIILVLLILNSQLEENLSKNKRGIDLVVGAKGSPLQLILANVYHIDFPTGNIKLDEAKALTRNRQVKSAIPLALGDNYQGFRIVGTNHDYTKLYEATLSEGALWKYNLECTIGSNVAMQLGLKVGDVFFGAHGLSDTDLDHDEASYKVVGILEPSNTALDNLILTNIESIWQVHDHSAEEGEEAEHSNEPVLGSAYETGLPEGGPDAEITSMLIQFRSAMGAVTMPRMINSNTNMQAASPAFETQRLFSLMGIGVNMIKSFAYIIIVIAGLSIFISLYNALKDRKYDLAIMRSLGASKSKLFVHVIFEGIIITTIGGVLGFILGHGLVEFLTGLYEKSDAIGISGMVLVKGEFYVLLISVGVGVLASILPAFSAYRTDISKVLAQE
ncbi:ABC transporter permease [Roseivirga echinicomitans]|uniref:ABC transporter permease n=1 Tax=Roseivirga echinicomitans TaxID=296218 RepID=A0A150XXE4_9BACT|nr:FtsX-like permease family protein [Roseivirga echinicomitans]KYG83302.1 ABC transporter permease [Roseivirga echinicomitans]